jgi:hypothetical protein
MAGLWHTSLSAVIRPPHFNRQLQPGSTGKIHFQPPNQTGGTLNYNNYILLICIALPQFK